MLTHSDFSTIGILSAQVKYALMDGGCQQMKNGSIWKVSLTANMKPEIQSAGKWVLEVMMLVARDTHPKRMGFSVRCIKDNK